MPAGPIPIEKGDNCCCRLAQPVERSDILELLHSWLYLLRKATSGSCWLALIGEAKACVLNWHYLLSEKRQPGVVGWPNLMREERQLVL